MKTLTAAIALLLYGGVHTEVAGSTEPLAWDYNSNGSDWGTIDPACAATKKGQSPIDLTSDSKAYPSHDIKKDNFSKKYENEKDVQVVWTHKTNKVTLKDGKDTNVPLNTSYFKSDLAKDLFKAHTNMWKAVQFHFHAGSEHTIDGERFDLEMHTVHVADPSPKVDTELTADEQAKQKTTQFGHAAMGILFSVTKYNVKLTKAEQLVIDTFFETLDLSKQDDPKVNLITYGNLMNMVDMNKRWIYQGSVTTPPCSTNVYWNVLQTIYPISQEQLLLFKAQQGRVSEGKLEDTGNWRVIQEYSKDIHKVASISRENLGSEMDTSNEIHHNINISIYNQNVISNDKCAGDL